MTDTRPPADTDEAPRPRRAPQVPDVTPHHALEEELLVARAQFAAHTGDLQKARRLLRDGAGSSASPSRNVFDLLARVHAQCGEFEDADDCWARVQAEDPHNREAAAGRALVARIQRGRTPARPRVGKGARLGAAALAAACAAAYAGAALTGAFGSGPASATDSASAQRAAARAGQEARRAEQFAARVAELEGDAEERRSELASQVGELADALAFTGVRVERRPSSVQITFREAPFVSGDRLTPEGSAALAELGRRLAGRDAKVTVVGHVADVAGADVSGGSPLALWRALVAVRTLSDHSGRALSSFATASGDARHAPSPDPDLNRTVTVTVSPAP